jgi:arginyl-tRNA--protein-N-Asp/Glu arginylyltransferase
MTRHDHTLKPQFYLTAPQPCPYLEGRLERKLFTALRGNAAATINDDLTLYGFRRSQAVAYRPACAGCSACVSVRIVVDEFQPSHSQSRTARRNASIQRRAVDPWAMEEQFVLFRSYLSDRHADGGMADMDVFDFAAMIEETPVRTRVVEYRDPEGENPNDLIGAALTDFLADGVSMVYSFFDPAYAKRSLGGYMILDHIEIARAAGLPYVYLGYWVAGSPKMQYKQRFQPLEQLTMTGWQRTDA